MSAPDDTVDPKTVTARIEDLTPEELLQAEVAKQLVEDFRALMGARGVTVFGALTAATVLLCRVAREVGVTPEQTCEILRGSFERAARLEAEEAASAAGVAP